MVKVAAIQQPNDIVHTLMFNMFVRSEWLRHTSARRSRKALPTTETELKLMAAAAMIGDRSRPNQG